MNQAQGFTKPLIERGLIFNASPVIGRTYFSVNANRYGGADRAGVISYIGDGEFKDDDGCLIRQESFDYLEAVI